MHSGNRHNSMMGAATMAPYQLSAPRNITPRPPMLWWHQSRKRNYQLPTVAAPELSPVKKAVHVEVVNIAGSDSWLT